MIGNYVADPNRAELPTIPGLDAGKTKMIKDALTGVTLKLRPDKSFVFAGGGSGGTLEGTWRLGEKGVTLVPKNPPKVANAPKEITLTRDAGKNELTLSQTSPLGSVKLVLVKNGS